MLLVVAVMLSLGRVQGAFRSGSVVMTQPDAIYNNQYLVEANVTTGALIGTYAPSHLKMALQVSDGGLAVSAKLDLLVVGALTQ